MISTKFHINNWAQWIVFLLLVIGVQHPALKAQIMTAPFALEVNSHFKKANLKSELLVLDTADILSPSDAFEALKNLNISHQTTTTSFGFSDNYYWLYFKVKNYSSTTQNLVVVVNNPHINQLQLYENEEPKPIFIAIGGDGIPFMNRTYIDRRFVAPIHLKPREKKEYALLIDKRHASVSVPISIENQQLFETSTTNSLLNLGVYFGLLILIVVYALVVFFKTKHEIFFWYAFYIFFLGLYLLAHLGLLFQYAHPNLFSFSDYARPLFVTWFSTGLVRFIQLLINTKRYLPKFEIWYRVLLVLLNVVTLWWWFTPGFHDIQTIWFLKIQNTIVVISLVMVLVSAVVTFRKQKTMVTFFFVAFLAVLLGGLSVIFIEIGVVSEDIFPVNPILVGSMVEIVVFAMGLSYWMKMMNDERIKLAKEMQGAKNRLEESYISGIETEKQKIASELHDDIGSRLSHLNRSLNPDEVDKNLVTRLTQINKTVRRLSHELAPPRFGQDQFLFSIKDLIKGHESKSLQISFQVFDVPENIAIEITKQLYRIIQSALSNIKFHSKATNVDVQLFYHNHELVLSIEDNGVGFILQSSYSGNGIKSMQSRVETLGGTIEISSSLHYGTSIMITIPIR